MGFEGLTGFEGRMVRRGDADYDRRRTVWNAMHDRRPALIARCTSARDVVAAIEYGRGHGMPIAVRGGGHSMPGHSTCDDGIVIDLGPMNAVRVDPVARRVKMWQSPNWPRPPAPGGRRNARRSPPTA